MAKYKVELDQKTCIGCRACTVACENFAPDNGKAKVVKEIIEQSEYKANKEGQDSCPVNCISITKIEEEKE
jgi:ferredoxin